MVRRWHADPFGFLRPWDEVPALMGSAPPATPPSTGTGVVTFLMGWRRRPGQWLSSLQVAFDGEPEAGVQSIGTGVVNVTTGDYFELIARQTSGSTKNVAADELTCFRHRGGRVKEPNVPVFDGRRQRRRLRSPAPVGRCQAIKRGLGG